ncbi:hypothetical protein CSPHI_08445 [Corynebacterium sphenisci DSM 44792]|uniref:Uncharacterized protein n=2 Tax=Corynebacterium sphenisci TaxID=191493 RepID=A0A1L7CZ00_9CORY|nr:hypothetical protein CSPHI_08445 [Corynebacterium sphenisci DSM 44792]
MYCLDDLAAKIVCMIWPKIPDSDETRYWIHNAGRYGEPWEGVDEALMFAADHDIVVPAEILDEVDQRNAETDEYMTMHRTVPALRKLLERQGGQQS